MTEDDDSLFALYNRDLMALSSQVAAPRRLMSPDASATAVSAICGSAVTVDLALEGGRVTDFGYSIDACALTKAVVAIMAQALLGTGRDDVARAAQALQSMLDGAAPPPGGVWEGLKVLAPVAGYKARHDTVMLPFEAVEKAFESVK